MAYKETTTTQVSFVTDLRTHPEHAAIGLLRIAYGWTFLWAFLDKLFGLGFSTSAKSAWINGGSPSTGYLQHAVNANSPFASFYSNTLVNLNHSLFGIVDWALMLMFLIVGVTMILGFMIRFSTVISLIFFVMVYISEIPFAAGATNPIVDEHIFYILIALVIVFTSASHYLGIGNRWDNLSLVRQYPLLK